MTTPKTDALMARWDDDGATRGAAFCELRDLARELEASLADANAHRQNLLTASKDWGRERDTLNQCLLQSQNAAIDLAQKNEELLTVLQQVQTNLDPHRDAVAWGIVVNAFLQYGPGPDAPAVITVYKSSAVGKTVGAAAQQPTKDTMKNKEYIQAAAAGESLVQICHGASERAGWWRLPNGSLSMDLKQEVRTGTRFGKALVAEKLALVHSEVSEGLEGHRKNKMDDHLPHRPMLEVELADAVIRIADLAGALGLDLGGAIAEKLAYNAERPDHKPEARAAEGGKAY